MNKINYDDVVNLSVELMAGVNCKHFVLPDKDGYLLTANLFDFFDELRVYLLALPSEQSQLVNLEAFQMIATMGFDKMKLEMNLFGDDDKELV